MPRCGKRCKAAGALGAGRVAAAAPTAAVAGVPWQAQGKYKNKTPRLRQRVDCTPKNGQ